MRNQNKPIATEGYPSIAGFAVTTVICCLIVYIAHFLFFSVFAGIFLILTVFSIFFFRNPERTTPTDENSVIAPADGTVIYLGEAFEDHLKEEMIKISIFMSIFNVHINRVPVTGKVLDSYYIKGKFLDVRDKRATFENERNALVLETLKGVKLVVVQVAGLVARRIVCYPKVGEMLTRGKRYGLIRFGSRLDVFLPKDTEIKVSMGEKTRSGETVLGILK
ncbi:MAG: phosphatidylserine decarboxylase family protein [Desulfuromonadales bacterium]|nr:phosphatidylserine decarboxylase family protein [Desulfuromonadales bacterium]